MKKVKTRGITGGKQFTQIVSELQRAGHSLLHITTFAELLQILAIHKECKSIPSAKIKATVAKACLKHYQKHKTLPVEKFHLGLGADKFPLSSPPQLPTAPPIMHPGPTSKAFLQSYEWRKVRYEALRLSDGLCCLCGRGKRHGIVLNVDHIKPRRTHPHLALSLSNLQVLCEDCNHGKGNWDSTDWR